MDISGKIIQFLQVQSGQGKNGTWKKQEFILETGDNYPKKVCIAVWGDKIDMGSFKTGDLVDVSFDVESREYNGRWYTDVKAWKMVPKNGGGGAGAPAANNANFNTMPGSFEASAAGDDDLPF
ncbi:MULTISPECIES: DUF3127 domain-containing protein [Niastella]|uniref:DUF3127 domain-containing protein n=1 Tax=Niastella soli TaxID=2821487 RepID=A0ABS3YPG6_9BACT|nr:DUF3127 domain-containing protein [Niastella soli]MBO9199778.1 DUF3127 domain-containing protein [Niastella soli]